MADQKKKVLLRLRDIKMHFPVKKDHVFQRQALSVRAVDGASIEIYEGETFGLVGESGCGKSTLGRVILQLYRQTAGSIRYYAHTLEDYAPAYALEDIHKIPSIKETNPAELIKKYPEVVSMAGGMLLSSDRSTVARLLAARHHAAGAMFTQELRLHQRRFDVADADDRVTLRVEKSMNEAMGVLKRCQNEIEAFRAMQSGKEGFAELEAQRDDGLDLSRLNSEEMRMFRQELQIIFQDPYSSLNPRLTIGNLISEALVAHNILKPKSPELEKYTLKVMEDCGLQHYMIHRYPHQFSGGQRQRIGIARALALKPRFIVCDEAVSALDVSIQSQIINLLMDLKEHNNLTYLFISHDLSTVKFISDRVAVMYLGDIVELGESKEIFADPLHPYTQALLEAIPTTDESSNKELQILEGDIPSPIRPPSGCKFHTRCKYATERCLHEVPAWQEYKPGHFVACHTPMNHERTQ